MELTMAPSRVSSLNQRYRGIQATAVGFTAGGFADSFTQDVAEGCRRDR
jgi:hypothetical protein